MIGITSLSSGSKGNATLIHNENEGILIDCGLSCKSLENKLQEINFSIENIKGIMITHEHGDHVKGIKVTAKKWDIPIYCNSLTASYLKHKEKAPHSLSLFTNGSSLTVGTFEIKPFSIPHDGVDTVAFTVHSENKKLAVATDFGYPSKMILEKLKECDAMLLESNHDIQMLKDCPKRPWSLKQRILSKHGHLSNEHCLEVLNSVLHKNLQALILGHVSEDTNEYSLVEDINRKYLEDNGFSDVCLKVARQHNVTDTIWLN